MENNNFGLEEVAANAVTTVADKLLDSKDDKGTTLLMVAVGAAGVGLGLLGTWGWNKFKNRKKKVIEVEAEVIEKDNNIH